MAGGIFLGIGLGGFFDGIVFHQILQWHHMISHVHAHPTTTVAGLEDNTLADGLFHAAVWIVTVVGLFLLWAALRDSHGTLSTRVFVGSLLLGWGLFNVVEGIVDHHLLQLHHVKEDSNHRLALDLAFLAWGAAMVGIGWFLTRTGEDETRASAGPVVNRS